MSAESVRDYTIAQAYLAKGKDAYNYRFNTPDPVQFAANVWKGVMHTSELYFLFDGASCLASSFHCKLISFIPGGTIGTKYVYESSVLYLIPRSYLTCSPRPAPALLHKTPRPSSTPSIAPRLRSLVRRSLRGYPLSALALLDGLLLERTGRDGSSRKGPKMGRRRLSRA